MGVDADVENLSLAELKLEHDPATPEIDDDDVQETSESDVVRASTSGTTADGFIFGAATRLGGRVLDNVPWDDEQESAAAELIDKQRATPVTPEEQARLNATPAKYWDKFYANVADSFFKDRSWLCMEFKELADSVAAEAGPKRICEIGCGTGATAYPLLASNKNSELFIHCLDYSERAIQLVKSNPAYDESCILAETWSLCDPNGLSPGVEAGSIDVAVLIFCLSALHPDEWQQAVKNLWTMLKPGGRICFRDYGRNDLTQLRFKKSRYMQPNLYARGDQTRVYFFTKDELAQLFSPDPPGETEDTTSQSMDPYRFKTIQLGVDRRLLVNRKRRIKMYRIWMQAVFEKPADA
ncbi:hypothetical protein EMMF5_004348 [Cystobasidiomycetes sp. EMM_F5]